MGEGKFHTRFARVYFARCPVHSNGPTTLTNVSEILPEQVLSEHAKHAEHSVVGHCGVGPKEPCRSHDRSPLPLSLELSSSRSAWPCAPVLRRSTRLAAAGELDAVATTVDGMLPKILPGRPDHGGGLERRIGGQAFSPAGHAPRPLGVGVRSH